VTEQAGVAARSLDYICEVHGTNLGQDNVCSVWEILLFFSDTPRKFQVSYLDMATTLWLRILGSPS